MRRIKNERSQLELDSLGYILFRYLYLRKEYNARVSVMLWFNGGVREQVGQPLTTLYVLAKLYCPLDLLLICQSLVL